MKNITPGIRKYGVALTTIFIIGALTSYYFLFYVAKNKEEIIQRNFRELNRTTQNINNRLTDYERMFDPLRTSAKYPGLIDSISLTDYFNGPPFNGGIRVSHGHRLPLVQMYTLNNDAKLAFNSRIKDSTYMRIFTSLKEYLQPILKKQFFTNYLLINSNGGNATAGGNETPGGKDKYEVAKTKVQDNTGISIFYNDMDASAIITSFDSLFDKRAAIKSNTTRNINIGGTDYTLFVAPFPFQVNYGGTWALVGLVSDSQLQKETFAVPQDFIFCVLFILLLLVLSFPFIKLALMNQHERLNISDILGSFACFVLLFGLLIFIFLHSYSIRENDKVYTDQMQKNITDSITHSFLADISKAYDQLSSYDQILHSSYRGYDITDLGKASRPVNALWLSDEQKFADYTGFNNGDFQPFYPDFSQVYWLDDSAYDFINWTKSSQVPPMNQYSDRLYYRNIRHQSYWNIRKGNKSDTFSFQPIYSWTDGEFKAVIAKPCFDIVREVGYDPQYPYTDTVIVACISSHLPSVINPILPADYKFCIIDEQGNVQFHSDKNKSLNENFIEECNANSSIVSAISNRTSEYFSGDYEGRDYRMYITPIANLPLYAVTLHDDNFSGTMNIEVFTFSSILSLFMALFSIIQLLILIVINRRRTSWNTQLLQAEWLWPKKTFSKLYLQIAAVNLFILIASIFVLNFNEGLIIEYVLFFNALVSISFFFYQINSYKPMPSARPIPRVFYAYFIIVVIALNITACYELSISSDYWTFMGYQVIILGACAIAIRNSYPDKISKFWNNLKPENYHKHYTCMLFTWLILSAGLPVVLIYSQSYNQEVSIYAKYNLLQTAGRINSLMNVDSENYDPNFRPNIAVKNGIQNVYGLKIHYNPNGTYPYTGKSLDRENKFLSRLFKAARIPYNSISKQEQELINAYDTDSGSISWARDKKNDLTLIYHDWSYNRGRTLTAQTKIARYLFPVPFTSISSSGFWLLIVLFLILIWYLINLLVRRSFLVNFFPEEADNLITDYLAEKIITPGDGYNRLYIVGPHDCGKLDLLKKELSTKSIIIIDFAALNNDQEWAKERAKLPEAANESWIILRHFEFGFSSAPVNEKKFDLINELIWKDTKNIVITSVLHPLTFLFKNDKNKSNDDITFINIDDNFYNWNTLLGHFKTFCYPLKNQTGKTVPDNKVLQTIYNECSHGYFLAGLENKLLADFASKEYSDHLRDEIISRVQFLASSYYHSIWNSLSLSEKYVLYDLSEDGLANGKNRSALMMLYNKGIIVQDSGGLAQVMNYSFRSFIIEEAKRDTTVVNDSARAKDSAWSKFRVPVYLIILATLFFVFYTQQEVFNKITTILASFTVAIPIIVRILSVVPGSKPNSPS